MTTAEIEGDGDSAWNSSTGSLTPVSNSAASSGNFSPRAMANKVLPSIEGASDGSPVLVNLSASGTRVPSLSLTPSESPSDHVSTSTTDRGSVARNTSIQDLDSQLEGLQLSTAGPLSMNGIADALQEVATGRDSRAGSLLEARPQDWMSPTPRRLSAHRRRSSSRNIALRHDVADETLPDDHFNDPAFQRVFREAKTLMHELVDILGSSEVHNQPDSVMQRLHGQAQDLARFQCPSSRTVGFIGDSGAGKSSLLNSLLDCRDLIRTSSGGAACTCAVTEYHFHAERGITIKIEQYSQDEMMAQLRGLLEGYRHFHLRMDSSNSENPNDQESYKDFENQANLAIDTFRAMFQGLRVNDPLLTSRSQGDVLELFEQWIRESGPANVQREQRGLTNDECSELLIRLTSENASASGPAIWPWIKKIKVYLNSYILSKGLILVDLPGLRDSNAARRHITERYFITCDEIFMVCVQDRAVTNAGVGEVVELARNANMSNVSIVCTKSDTYNDPVEAQRDFPGPTARLIQQKVDAKAQVAMQIQDIEISLEEYEQDIGEDNLTEEESRDFDRLGRRLRTIKKSLTELEFDLQQFLITTCNNSIQSRLIAEYGHQYPDNTLKVFCVSNKIYWDHREAPRDVAMQHLILSGILAIREHGMAMVSQAQYTAAKNYMRGDISLLLGELSLWVQAGHGSLTAEQRHNVRETLTILERRLQEDLCGRSSELQRIARVYREDFHTKIYQAGTSHTAVWSAGARHASNNWTREFHHSSYDAFCRKFGVHSVKNEGLRYWNREIIEKMVQDLGPLWGDLNASIMETNDGVLDRIDEVFDSASDFLDSNLDDSSDATTTLISTLTSHEQLLKDHIETILDKLQGDLRTLRTDALSSLRSSYIGKAMETAYNRAGYQHGTGRHARQKSIINATVQSDDLFTGLLREFRREFRDQAEKTQELIRTAVSSHLDNIRNTFNIVREENAMMENESDLAFKRRVEDGVRAAQDQMERIYEVLG
ncbi:hypothetical protein F5Y19DRAFT_445793 [Xylariaceae sp. FL1651]|nr:hypothetical protein F5Y19DRAFT_445793 [Xylariaceae sp. FL1651]